MGLEDDIAYVGILVASICCGKLVRLVPPELGPGGVRSFKQRRILSTLLGLLVAWLVSGWALLHLLAQILGTCLIMTLVDHRFCHLPVLAWCFSYLFFFRLSPSLGFSPPPPHTNAIIMIMTLKLVGLAFEVRDTVVRREEMTKKQAGKEQLETSDIAQYSDVEFSVSGLGHYTLGHVGLITGPYYKYSTWLGLTRDPWNPSIQEDQWSWGTCERAAWARLRNVPAYIAAFLVSGYLFPLSVVETQEWQDNTSFLWKIFYMMPVFFNFRMRIYAGFILSECACIMAGLGAYPAYSEPRPGQGPVKQDLLHLWEEEGQDKSINFETVHNIDEWGTDFVSSMREALRCWNMTVQHWLVMVVYKRFPVRHLRTLMVMLVSSVWHGVHPGYYLSLGSVPFFLVVEDLYRSLIRKHLSPSGQRAYDWVNWFIRMRWFDYLGMAFLLLRVDTTLTYWTGVGYIQHVAIAIAYLVGRIVIQPLVDKSQEAKKGL